MTSTGVEFPVIPSSTLGSTTTNSSILQLSVTGSYFSIRYLGATATNYLVFTVSSSFNYSASGTSTAAFQIFKNGTGTNISGNDQAQLITVVPSENEIISFTVSAPASTVNHGDYYLCCVADQNNNSTSVNFNSFNMSCIAFQF